MNLRMMVVVGLFVLLGTMALASEGEVLKESGTTPTVSFYTAGYGTRYCQAYLNAYAKNSRLEWAQRVPASGNALFVPQSRVYLEWTQGYITAFNMMDRMDRTGKKQILADMEKLSILLKSACEKVPTDSVVHAVDRLVEQLQREAALLNQGAP